MKMPLVTIRLHMLQTTLKPPLLTHLDLTLYRFRFQDNELRLGGHNGNSPEWETEDGLLFSEAVQKKWKGECIKLSLGGYLH